MSKKDFALVKWLTGNDKGKYTAGIPIEWIMNFDKHKYLAEKPNTPYVLQWKCGRKPKGGWRCYDLTVAAISDSIATLERTILVMDAVKSPRVITDQENDNETSSPVEPKRSRVKNKSDSSSDSEKSPKKKRKLSYDEESDECLGYQEEKIVNFDKKSTEKTINKPFPDLSGIHVIDESPSYNESVKNVVMENNKMLKELLKKTNFIVERMTSCSNNGNVEESKIERKKPTAVKKREIGWKGSNAFVTENQWYSAISKPSANLMGVDLLTSVFTIEELLSSNLKGGQSKIKKGDVTEPEKRKALDENKIKAIEQVVEEKFGSAYNRSQLRIAINNKLSRIRSSSGSAKTSDKDSGSKDDDNNASE